MIQPLEPVSDWDLNAYVDGQLDALRRAEIEDYLSRHPEAAARVMADLGTRDLLRLALAEAPMAPRPATTSAARRLDRALGRLRLYGSLRRIAAVALLVAAGWIAHAELNPLAGVRQATAAPPEFVLEALSSHRAAQIRAVMHSQPPVQDFDPDEIRAATDIVVPRLPAEWQLRDVQVFPSTHGPSVELTVDAGALGILSIFAVHSGGFGVIPPTVADEAGETTAFWQFGDLAYAVTGTAPRPALDRAAQVLAASLY